MANPLSDEATKKQKKADQQETESDNEVMETLSLAGDNTEPVRYRYR